MDDETETAIYDSFHIQEQSLMCQLQLQLKNGEFTQDPTTMGPSPDADGVFYSIPTETLPRIVTMTTKQSPTAYEEDDEEEDSQPDDIGNPGKLHICAMI